MTVENAKRLYDHFVASGQTENAENILLRRPELKQPEKKSQKESGKE
jgi:hypothetical protein